MQTAFFTQGRVYVNCTVREDEKTMCYTKNGVEGHLRTAQPPCAYAMANCVYTADGQWAVKREGGGWTGEKGGEAGRANPFGGTSGA
jgi:hypothetical protein